MAEVTRTSRENRTLNHVLHGLGHLSDVDGDGELLLIHRLELHLLCHGPIWAAWRKLIVPPNGKKDEAKSAEAFRCQRRQERGDSAASATHLQGPTHVAADVKTLQSAVLWRWPQHRYWGGAPEN